MSSPIIRVENLSKKFVISHEGKERYLALRDVIANKAKSLIGREKNSGSGSKEEFWALKDIEFSIGQGERVGIIGRNGAGKSTLLKVLSRIIEPSTGRISIGGRVASLLEVGTGFHPELTGRENIYLNGSILGMARSEIRTKFDEIVEFAEIERFLDTPVKRYSSGMYVRLAFAVAAHLEPEILIVDEVLAVGDAQFQRKCLGKMEQVSKEGGRTILFVTHQMPTVLNLCEKCIHLERGRIKEIGPSNEVVANYLSEDGVADTIFSSTSHEGVARKAAPYFHLDKFYLAAGSRTDLSVIEASENLEIDIVIEGQVEEVDERFNIGFMLKDEYGNCIIMSYSTDQPEDKWIKFSPGHVRIVSKLDTSILSEGKYFIYLLSSLHCVRMLYTSEDNICVGFEIVGNRGNSPYWTTKRSSILAPYIDWRVSK